MNFNKFIYGLGLTLLGGLVLTGCRRTIRRNPAIPSQRSNTKSAQELGRGHVHELLQNASSYAWDFGDGNTSTDESPVHTYAAGGTYDVTLTATGAAGSASRTETINIVDPNTAGMFLSGAEGKTWYLDREAIAMGIGPGPGDVSWWSFGGVTPWAASMHPR